MSEKKKPEELAAEWFDPKDLVKWARNPRKYTGEEIEEVARSIDRFGFGAPIVARRANKEMIAGHRRHLAALRRQLPRVPVRFMDISERDAHLLALADNRLPEKPEWDVPELESILGDYTLNEVKTAGWSASDLDALADEYMDENGGDGGGEDDSDNAIMGYAVVIECDDEAQQIAIIDECQKKGWNCRALV